MTMEQENTEDLTLQEVEEFLQDNPNFVNKWLCRKYETDDSNIDYAQILEMPTTATDLETKCGILFKQETCYFCHKILQNACILLNCDRASLFLFRGTAKMRYLVSKLFDVTATSVMDDTLHTQENAIRIPFGKGFVGYVAENNRLLNIKDAYEDARFLDEFDKITGFRTKSILSAPITDRFGMVIGVAQVLNKKHGQYFNSDDENIFMSFLSFCGISINNEQLLEMSNEECKRHRLLLKLTKFILKEQINFRKLISEILRHAMEMLNCSKICVYLTENRMDAASATTSSTVFQLLRDEREAVEVPLDPKYITPINQNLKSINIIDTIKLKTESKDMLITVEGDVGNWLLCMTITNARNKVIGCIIFVRHSKDVFNQSDINIMETFALICGISIYNCRLYERSVRIIAQREVMNDVLAYYTTCDRKAIEPFLKVEPRPPEEYHIYSFDFDTSVFTDDELILLCARIFLEKNALIILNLPIDILYRFILTAKKNYRQIIYHNWHHAVNVMQSMFSILTTGQMQLYFTGFEQICLLIATMVHDIDHRGKNNAFQVKTSSPFAKLYSSSVLEQHHKDRTFMILNNTDTNIFRNLSAKTYKYGLKFIEKAILATDLQYHFERRVILKEKLASGNKTFDTPESVEVLMSILMTASDLSAITKPWKIQRSTAVMVAAEFYEQGDEEKYLDKEVQALMDRENRYKLPKMQVEFIDSISFPLYQLLSEVQDSTIPLYEGMLKNRIRWSNIVEGLEDFDIDLEMQKVYNKYTGSKCCNDQRPSESTYYSEENKIFSACACTQTILIFPKIKEPKQCSEKCCQTDPVEEEIQKVSSVIEIFGSCIILETAKKVPDKKLLSLKVETCKDKESRGVQTQVLKHHGSIKKYGYVSNVMMPSKTWTSMNLELSDFIQPTKASTLKSRSSRSSIFQETGQKSIDKSSFVKNEEKLKTDQVSFSKKSIQFKEDLIFSEMIMHQPLLRVKSSLQEKAEGSEKKLDTTKSINKLFPAFSSTNISSSEKDFQYYEEEARKNEQTPEVSCAEIEVHGMSAEEKEKIASDAKSELNQRRRRKCFRKIPKTMSCTGSTKKQKDGDYIKKWMCTIS